MRSEDPGRRASSAGADRPSPSLTRASAGSKRCEEAKQGHDPSRLSHRCEPLEKRGGEPRDGDRRREASPPLPPEGRARKLGSPPLAPARQRAPVDPELASQRLGPARGDSVSQGRHHHHDDAEVHAAPEKTQRRRRPTPTASLAGTAEAEPPLLVGREIRRSTTGLAGVVGSMEPTPAGAPLGAHLLGEIPVERGEKGEEPGVAQQSMPHWKSPPGVGT